MFGDGVSLAVTHFERFDMVLESFAKVLEDPRVKEVVISDDASVDGSYELLTKYANSHSSVRLFRNPTNIDCYRNKAKAIARASNPWVVILDSDNVIGPDYLDALERELPWERDTAYLPTFAMPHFDYREFEGLTVDRSNVARYAKNRTFLTALNTANYLVHQVEYLYCFDSEAEPYTADSIFMNYRWLRAGNRLRFVPGLHYQHRVHDGSHYRQNHHKTGRLAERIERALQVMR